MSSAPDFASALETKVVEQFGFQRVGYLLGAGSSYLNGDGYPLASGLWALIKPRIADSAKRDDIQAKLDAGAHGIEQALDLLDDGGANDTPYRHLVTTAIADLFITKSPPLDLHCELVRRIAQRADPCAKIFSLNYDPLIERATDRIRARLVDGFLGSERCYFDAAVFQERIGRIRGNYKGRRFDETVKPIHLLKLHGSLGWYESLADGVRRCAFGDTPPDGAKRLMIPPQRRKATDTTLPPFAALWSAFRGCLVQDATPLNRLVSIGYGFADEHVNAVIESALARTDFTLLIFTKAISGTAWARWSGKANVIIVTESQCSLKGRIGAGHPNLWSFERIAKEI